MPSLPGENKIKGSFKNKTAAFLQWRDDNKCTFHFIALIVFLSVLPLLEDSEAARIFTDVHAGNFIILCSPGHQS